jgi:hypothetical protein
MLVRKGAQLKRLSEKYCICSIAICDLKKQQGKLSKFYHDSEAISG